MNAIADFLYGILEGITSVVQNHGISIIIFTILMRLICVPFDYKSRKGMRKMAAIQPKLAELQKKYANDKQKFQQKQAELMRKEHYNPLSSCLPMLLTWPLMIAMFSAMRMIANEQLAMQAFRYLLGEENPIQPADTFLWIKNIWMTDSPFASIAPDANSLGMLTAEVWNKVVATFSEEQLALIVQNIQTAVPEFVNFDFSNAEAMKASVAAINSALHQIPAYQSAVATVPGWTNVSFLLFSITVFVNYNGFLILPALAGITQLLQTKFNPQMKEQEKAQAANPQQNGTGKFMKYFFPVLSVFFCLTSNAGFALYWVTSNVVMWVLSIAMTKFLEKQDKKNATAIAGEGTVK